MAAKHGLGRGLGALISDGMTVAPGVASAVEKDAIVQVPLDRVQRSRMQPRQAFDSEPLEELTASIRERGVLQPLLVRPSDGGYELIAGERRFRASQEAGLTEVPVIVMDVDDRGAMELALIENLQRENLNVLEEAEGYKVLADRFDLTQEEIAQRVGKARASIANTMRLLDLEDEPQAALRDGRISAGHAKLLVGLDIADEQVLYLRRTLKENLSVRNLERALQKRRVAPRKPRAARTDIPAGHLSALSDELHRHFGTSVSIVPTRTYANGKKSRGHIDIDFYSNEDLDRILALLGVSAE